MMQHADDQHRVRIRPIEHHMRLLPDAAQARCEFVGAAAQCGIIDQGVETALELAAVLSRLFDTESSSFAEQGIILLVQSSIGQA